MNFRLRHSSENLEVLFCVDLDDFNKMVYLPYLIKEINIGGGNEVSFFIILEVESMKCSTCTSVMYLSLRQMHFIVTVF